MVFDDIPTTNYDKLASFELHYTDKEKAHPFIEALADLTSYLKTESSLDKAEIYRSEKMRSYGFDQLSFIATSHPKKIENVIGQVTSETEYKFYFHLNYFYVDRHDITRLNSACKQMIKDGVTNPKNEYKEPIMFYDSENEFNEPMSSFDISFNRNHGVVRFNAEEDVLKVDILGHAHKIDDNDANLFIETLSYANHKNVPITFNHSGLEKKSSEHEKSYHARFKSFKFNQYENVSNIVDNTVDSVGSFFSGLYKKGKDWLKN